MLGSAINSFIILPVVLGMFLILLCKPLSEDYDLDVLLLYQFMDHPGINLLKIAESFVFGWYLVKIHNRYL